MPGRQLEGVHFALEFLIPQNKEVAGDEPNTISAKGCNVIVIGGGDTGSIRFIISEYGSEICLDGRKEGQQGRDKWNGVDGKEWNGRGMDLKEWNGTGMEWNGWTGMEWNGMEWI